MGKQRELPGTRGAAADLNHEGEVAGKALRTRIGLSPIFVSVGHLMDLATAVEVTLSASPCDRIPEPIRQAHRLSNELRRSALPP